MIGAMQNSVGVEEDKGGVLRGLLWFHTLYCSKKNGVSILDENLKLMKENMLSKITKNIDNLLHCDRLKKVNLLFTITTNKLWRFYD